MSALSVRQKGAKDEMAMNDGGFGQKYLEARESCSHQVQR
jgi:hypothetical protein